jgi:hypothetical protein
MVSTYLLYCQHFLLRGPLWEFDKKNLQVEAQTAYKYDQIDRLHLGSGPHGPDAPRPFFLTGPLCPMSNHGSPVTLLKFQMVPKIMLLMSSGSKKERKKGKKKEKKKEPRYACLSEIKASHSQRIWAEVSSLTPHLHNGLSNSPSR